MRILMMSGIRVVVAFEAVPSSSSLLILNFAAQLAPFLYQVHSIVT